jgi:hypothetical protein
MNRDRRDLELAGQRTPVEGFNVGQLVDVAERGVDEALGERVEHERVVGVGGMADMDGLCHVPK